MLAFEQVYLCLVVERIGKVAYTDEQIQLVIWKFIIESSFVTGHSDMSLPSPSTQRERDLKQVSNSSLIFLEPETYRATRVHFHDWSILSEYPVWNVTVTGARDSSFARKATKVRLLLYHAECSWGVYYSENSVRGFFSILWFLNPCPIHFCEILTNYN
jgi:hypothetical protein